jgi:hypothetical protein
MSRTILFSNDRFSLVGGEDHVLGRFVQLFDKEMVDETPEQEGLVLDWSEGFGLEINYTGISNDVPVHKIIVEYIKEHNNE